MSACLTAGCGAFLLMLAYDLVEMRSGRRIAALFFAGLGLLGGATVFLLVLAFDKAAFMANVPLGAAGALCAAACACFLGRVLFAELPYDSTYRGEKKPGCVDTGWYALCRHPGALWLAALYLSLALALRTLPMLWGGLLFSGLNVAYVAAQDRWIFPKTIPGYAAYQRGTPFLIPTAASIRRWKSTRTARNKTE